LPNGAIAIDTTNHVFYFRSNNEWLEVSGGATVTVDDSPPLDPEIGDLWYSSLELELFIYYSNAWIQLTDAQGGVQELYELSDVLIDDPVYGQTLVYNGTEWENDFITTAQSLQTARAISLAGDVSGSVAFDGSQNVSISATIQPNSVALGTDTTGNYVNDLTAGTGVTITHTPGEGSSPTVAIGQSVATTASVSFAHVATNSLNVVNNIVGTGNITLSPTISSYEIGDTGPAGGKIFITPSTSGNTTGKYFEVAPIAGEVIRKWATDTDPGIGLGNAATTVVGADGTDIGTGQQNTADIVAQIGNVAATSAAVYCDEYSYGGFSDWFLPSKDELNELYVQRNVVGGLQVSYYSTSSEYSNDAFWFQSFIDGYPNTPYKNNAYYIRPVRSFVAPAPAGIITGNLTGNVTGNVTGNASTATTLETARTISLSGDVSGSVSFNGSANATISTAIQPNSVALGTDTTGNYMSDLTQGTGITITHTPGEGSNATIAIGQAVATSSSVSFARLQTSGDVVVGGDLTVNGTTTTLNTETLLVEDNIVVLNSGITASPTLNSGIEVERGTSDNVSMRWNESADRWEFTNDGSAYNNVLLKSDISLNDISDTVITSAANGQLLEFDGTNWVNAVRPSSEPMGHENKADSVISFNEGTRTFSIAPASTSFTVWCAGKRFVKTTTETVQIPDTSGLYYIYYNSSGVLSHRTTFFVWDTDAPTAYVYWNEVDNKAYFFADERHGVTLDWATHEYLHRTRGAAIANGFGANNYILNGDGSSNTHATIDIADGTFFDEDLQVDITHSATPTANTWEQVLQGNAEIPVFYRLNNHWVKDAATEFPMKQGTDRPRYNLNTAGTWSTPDVANNRFGVSWIIATNNLNEPVIAILGQGSYTDNGSAQAEFYASLNLDGFPIVEFRPLYKIIYECKTSYTNTPSARITDVIDLRSVISSDQGVGTTPVSDHGSMTGLADDDHTQYLTDARHDALDHTTAISSASLDDIGNVSASAAASGDFLKYDGANWVNDPINLGTDTVGNYMSDLTQGTGVAITHTPGEGSNATIAIGQAVATSSSVTFANVTSTGNVAISGRIDKTTVRESVADVSVSASAVTANYATGDIFYLGTAPSSNFALNLTNAPTDNGKAITVVLFVTQGATGYYPDVVKVAGVEQEIKWANFTSPTPSSGNAGVIDIFSFTFVRRSSAWTVFGSSNLGYSGPQA
jgi:hypothetical protein